jgi:hypothetical protein
MKAAVSALVALVSTLNILVFVVVGILLEFASRVDVPSWYFAVFGSVTILVTAVSWRQSLRMPPGPLRLLAFSLRSVVLVVTSMVASLSLFSGLLAAHPVQTVYRADAWPVWVCLVAMALAYVRLELEPAPTTILSPLLTRVPDPTRAARILSAISMTAFLASIALTVIGGLLQSPVPPWALLVQPIVLLVVLLGSLFKRNRWVPTGAFWNLRAVTPIRLGLLALPSIFIQLPLAVLISDGDGGLPPSVYGILVLFGVFLIGMIASFHITDDGPTRRGKRPRGAAPLVDVGVLPRVEVGPVAGWTALPSRFPADGQPNPTAWANAMLPRIGADIGTGTDEQKRALAHEVVRLINSRLARAKAQLFVVLDEWEGPRLVAGLADELAQDWAGMPVKTLEQTVAADRELSGDPPLTGFTTASGLEGHRRMTPDRVDYFVSVEGGWAHLDCEDTPDRIVASLDSLDALAAAIFVGDRVVGRRKATSP